MPRDSDYQGMPMDYHEGLNVFRKRADGTMYRVSAEPDELGPDRQLLLLSPVSHICLDVKEVFSAYGRPNIHVFPFSRGFTLSFDASNDRELISKVKEDIGSRKLNFQIMPNEAPRL